MSATTDVNPKLESDLDAHLALLDPQIRGLQDLTRVSISADLMVPVNAALNQRLNRRDLTNAAKLAADALDTAVAALEADGYPDLPDVPLSPTQATEMTEQSEDLNIAINIFEPPQPASQITANLGAPETKPPAQEPTFGRPA